MKKWQANNSYIWVALFMVCVIITSCQKSFDPNSYKPVYTIGGYSSSKEVAASNLVAYWAFEGSYIDSISKTQGTPNHVNAISFVNGTVGQAVEVASPGFINTNIATTVAGLQSFTYVCWINHPANLAAGPYTYMPWSLNQAGYSWEQTKFFLLFNNADKSSQTYAKIGLMDQWFDKGQIWPAMLDGNWHNLAVSYNGSTGAFRIYIDGALLSSSSSFAFNPQSNFGTATSFTLGGPDDNASAANTWMNSLSGDLDEFKIFNRELTTVEIKSMYLLQLKGK